MITICFTYFKSLTLANLAAALHSVRQQDLSQVKEIVIIDNDTVDSGHEIRIVADALAFPVPVRVLSFKHGDSSKTHAWSTNKAVQEVTTPLVFFTRADYILRHDVLARYAEKAVGDCFVTGDGYHLNVDITECDREDWRGLGVGLLHGHYGAAYDYGVVDTGVWLATKAAFSRVGGLDERLTAWGHAQTHFQHRLAETGTTFVRIPEVLFYHPRHGGQRDIHEAHAQLAQLGVDLRQMWSRYHGVSPYGVA